MLDGIGPADTRQSLGGAQGIAVFGVVEMPADMGPASGVRNANSVQIVS